MERESGLADPSGWWRLSVAEEGFLTTKHPRTRLAAAVELVHYRQTGRFLKAASDLPPGVVDQLAAVTGADSDDLEGWLWSSRTSRRHRAEILEFLGIRRLSRRDMADRLISWFFERRSNVRRRTNSPVSPAARGGGSRSGCLTPRAGGYRKH